MRTVVGTGERSAAARSGVGQAQVREDGRVDLRRERPHLVERAGHLGAELGQHRPGPGGVLIDQLPRQLEPDAEGHEPLLRPVVQIALDPPPLVVGGGLDPRARVGQLAQGTVDVGDQAPVLVPDEGIRADGADERALPVERGIVDDRREVPVAVADLRPGPARSGGGRQHGRTLRVDPAAAGRACSRTRAPRSGRRARARPSRAAAGAAHRRAGRERGARPRRRRAGAS